MNSKKEKYLQIFNYLLKFSKLRSNPVRDILNSPSNYPEIIWFSDIPLCDEIDSVFNKSYDNDSDYWLKIRKPRNEPVKPQLKNISAKLSKWIDLNSKDDINLSPKLFESITEDNVTIVLNENIEIKKVLDEYISKYWQVDFHNYKLDLLDYQNKLIIYNNHNDIYKKFFTIFNKIQNFGEEYELILGIGLLNYKENDNTPLICRHIFTLKVLINIETSKYESSIQILPSLESNVQIETDAFIDLPEQFDSIDIISAEKSVTEFINKKEIQDDPFNNDFKDAIQMFAERMSSDGKFLDSQNKPESLNNKPTLYYAPAIILRKRNTKSLTSIYEKIIEDISKSDSEIDITLLNDLIDDNYNPNIVLISSKI